MFKRLKSVFKKKAYILKKAADVFHTAVDSISSMRMQLLIKTTVIAVVPLVIVSNVMAYYYTQEIIRSEIATMQTNAAVIADEYTDYTTITEGNKSGVSTLLVKYSNMNAVRIRVLDTDFIIRLDSYSIDNGKNVLNERAVKTYVSGKSVAEYDEKTGTLEAVVPVYNINGSLVGVLLLDKDISEINHIIKDVREYERTLLAAVSIAMVAALFIFFTLEVRNIKRVFGVVEDIAEGHTERRIEARGYSEVRDFAKNFNLIMDRANVIDENRQEFVSNVSHELKTPITSIKVLAESLNMQEDVPIELYKEFMSDITSEIDRESKIIEDLLLLVKMDKTASSLNISSVNLNNLLELILKRLKPIAQKKNVEILFESFRPVVAEVDEVKFTQVISNLVENAIKYNNIDGWVHVSLNADHQYFYVRVEDSGIGIPQESQDKVFDRFYRVDKARSRETGGTGLGLAIVQQIILMHHGTVKLHSEEGHGTTFTVRIPLNYVG